MEAATLNIVLAGLSGVTLGSAKSAGGEAAPNETSLKPLATV